MLSYPKNVDLEGTREEGKLLLHSSNPENPGSGTELGLVSQIHQNSREERIPGQLDQPEFSPVMMRMGKEEWKKYKRVNQMFLEKIAFFVFVQSFQDSEYIWKELCLGRGVAPESQSPAFPQITTTFSSQAKLVWQSHSVWVPSQETLQFLKQADSWQTTFLGSQTWLNISGKRCCWNSCYDKIHWQPIPC